MDFTELKAILQNLTNSKISFSQIAEILKVTPANISKRASAKSEITVSELKAIEMFYDKRIYKSPIYSIKRHFDENIQFKLENLGKRIAEIQEKNNLSDSQMAMLLNISNENYLLTKNSQTIPDTKIINNIKQNFKISLDWLLYGE